jgi:Glycerophosphoryl diester phosphodiesterase
MEYMIIIILTVVILVAFNLWPGGASEATRNKFYGRNYAHRGLYKRDQSIPENSVAAFAAAADAGYGMELDIQLSSDGEVVVFHDDNLLRACSVDKRVDELTLAELKELSLFGTEHRIPTLTEVFDVVKGSVPIIVEVKTGHRNSELCENAYALLKEYKGDFCVESFHPGILGWFRNNAKEVFRGQLSASAKGFRALSKLQAFVLSNLFTNVTTRAQFIAYRVGEETAIVKFIYAIGTMRVAWTIDDTMDAAVFEEKYDAIIFEHYLPAPVFKELDFINKDRKEEEMPAGKNQYLE